MRGSVCLRAGLIAGFMFAAAPGAFAANSLFASLSQPTTNDARPLVSPIPRETVAYNGPYAPGTIVINTSERRLYLVLPDHQALKYGVGVGRPGFTWAGVTRIGYKREWPDWTAAA